MPGYVVKFWPKPPNPNLQGLTTFLTVQYYSTSSAATVVYVVNTNTAQQQRSDARWPSKNVLEHLRV